MASLSNNTNANIRIARNTFYMTIRMILVLCLTLFSTRVVLNALGVVEYGVYNVVAGFVSLFSFLGTSMSNAIQRFYNYEYAQKGVTGAKIVFNTSILIQLVLAILLVLILELIGPWYIQNKMVLPESLIVTAKNLFHLSVISFVCVIFQAPFVAAVMAHERMGFFSIVSVLDATLKLSIAFSLPYFVGSSLVIYGLLLLISQLIILTLYIIYTRIRFEEVRFSISYDIILLKSMLSFSGWNIFGTFSGVMKEHGVNIIMNLFFGPVVNAAKGIANQVNNGIQSFVSNIIIPARPHLVQSYSLGKIHRVMNLTYSVSKFSTLVLYMIALPLISEIDYVLKLWLGTNIPEYSASFVKIVVVISFINNLNGSISGVVHASGKMKNYQLFGALVNILAVPVVYMALRIGGTPQLAMVLVAFITLINQIVCMMVLRTIVSYSYKDYILKVILPFILVLIATFWIPIIVKLIIEPSFYRLFIITILCILAVLIATYYCGVTPEERVYLKEFIIKLTRHSNIE